MVVLPDRNFNTWAKIAFVVSLVSFLEPTLSDPSFEQRLDSRLVER